MRLHVFVLLILVASIAHGSEIDSELLSRLKTEGPAGWGGWEEQNRHIEAAFTEIRWLRQSDESFNKDPHYTWKFHYFSDDGRMRRSLAKILPSGQEFEDIKVFRSGNYSFKAERIDDTPFVATEVKNGPRPQDLDFPVGLKWPYSIQHRDLRELMLNPRFRINGIGHDGTLVRVDFVYDMDDDPLPLRFRSGNFVLDPDLRWAIRSYEILSPKLGVLVRLENEYGSKRGDFIPLVQTTRRFQNESNAPRRDKTLDGNKEVWEFNVYRPNNSPDSFYTFEAVGLPNLARQSSGWGVWFWVINAGIMCLLAAWWLRRRLVTGRY